MRALSADRASPACPGRSSLVDGSKLECALPSHARQVIVVVLRTSGLGLEPRRAQAEARSEFVELIDGVCLQVAASTPPSPIADRERVVDIHRQFDVRRTLDTMRHRWARARSSSHSHTPVRASSERSFE